MDSGFPSQRDNNSENNSMARRLHEYRCIFVKKDFSLYWKARGANQVISDLIYRIDIP